MYKYRYFITYKVRPNKKSEGAPAALNVSVGGSLDEFDQQVKVQLMLSKLHRVNVDAIELIDYSLISRTFLPKKWLVDTIKGWFGRFKRDPNTEAVKS